MRPTPCGCPPSALYLASLMRAVWPVVAVEPTRLPSTGPATSLHDRCIDHVFGDEPHLEFVPPDDIAHDQIVRAVVSSLGRATRHGARPLEHDLVCMDQARDLDWNSLAPPGRPWNQRRLCDVVRHRNAHPAEQLNALRHGVDYVVLLLIVLIEEEMELIERRAGHLPVMFLVQVAKRHRVSEQLIQILDALFAPVLRQWVRNSDKLAQGQVLW